MCLECGGELKGVREVLPDEESPHLVSLVCGHIRLAGLLPLKPGRISVEHMSTKLGRDVFPILSEVFALGWRS
jgi:hypothetical protein